MTASERLQHCPMHLAPTEYWERHMMALQGAAPLSTPTHERAMSLLLRGWAMYADAHKLRYDAAIGDDGVLGDPWSAIGCVLLTLLNGETGRLDFGAIDGAVRDILRTRGAEVDE